MNDLSFADLQAFERMAATGSLSAAARELQVSVATVSRQLERTERSVGAALFVRSTQGLALTPEGDVFLQGCARSRLELERLREEMSRSNGRVSGPVRVSASAAVATGWLAPSLPSLMARHPELTVDLLVNDDRILLGAEGVDVAIRTGVPLPPSGVARPLGRIDTALYVSPKLLATSGQPQTVEALQGWAQLVNCRHAVLNHWRFGGGATLTASGPVRANTTALVMDLAVQGLGVACLPQRLVAPALQNGLLVRLEDVGFQSHALAVHAVFSPTLRHAPRLRACLAHWADWFAGTAPAPGQGSATPAAVTTV
jgi:DNA-binding transcriptional LysR family regulator